MSRKAIAINESKIALEAKAKRTVSSLPPYEFQASLTSCHPSQMHRPRRQQNTKEIENHTHRLAERSLASLNKTRICHASAFIKCSQCNVMEPSHSSEEVTYVLKRPPEKTMIKSCIRRCFLCLITHEKKEGQVMAKKVMAKKAIWLFMCNRLEKRRIARFAWSR